MRALLAINGAARLKFVVGEGASDAGAADVLLVPVGEQLLMRKFAGGRRKKISGVSSYSTYSLYLKTMHFLRYAALQPEPAVVLGDDDIFVQPHALLGYIWSLLEASRRPAVDGAAFAGVSAWYAGRFDWYSWRTETMQATAYWRAMRGALYGAQEWFRNCSPSGNGWVRAADGKRVIREAEQPTPGKERCVGPFAFAKGPLTLLSAPVVRWVIAQPAFASDLKQAAAIANGSRPYGRAIERVPQDVQLGYWLREHPTLRYVNLPRKTGWADAFVEVTDLRKLVIGHRIPWDQLAWLTGRTERLWAASTGARLHLRCAGPPCPLGQCAHARGQVSCAAELLAPSVDGYDVGCTNCECWERTASASSSSGGRCNFTRSAAPELPGHCYA